MIWIRRRQTGRVLEPELLEHAQPREAERNLLELARINRWFGGHRALLRVMRGLAAPEERFSALDVGAASGDMGRRIREQFPNATVTSLDLHRLHLRRAEGPRVVADAFALPFRAGAFDFVLCSSFLHHFPDAQVVELMAGLRRFARRALIVLDLERHAAAYHFLAATRKLFRWSELTVHDGSASVAAAFRAEEMRLLAETAAAAAVRVRKHRPWFRISVVLPAGLPAEEMAADECLAAEPVG